MLQCPRQGRLTCSRRKGSQRWAVETVVVVCVGVGGLILNVCNGKTALLTCASWRLCCGWLTAATAKTAQSIDVYHLNYIMGRNTTCRMSAVAGGSDAFILAFGPVSKGMPNEFWPRADVSTYILIHLLQLSEASGEEEEEEGNASKQAFRLVMCNELRDQRMRTDAAQEWATWDRGHCLSLQWSSRGSALYDVSRLENPEVCCWEHCVGQTGGAWGEAAYWEVKSWGGSHCHKSEIILSPQWSSLESSPGKHGIICHIWRTLRSVAVGDLGC